jgi:glycerol-3-phosphate acyltransferase PlsX
VALKAMEGAAQFMIGELRGALTSGLMATLGAALARSALLKFRERLSPTPAAPLLGLNGIVLKCHGGASDRDFAMAIRLAADLARSDFSAEIERNMRRLPDALAEPAQPPVEEALADAVAPNGGSAEGVAPQGASE